MCMQTILQALKVVFLLIFIIIDLFGMFHGLSAAMPFKSNNVNVMGSTIYGYSILLISVFGFFKLLDCAKKVGGFVGVVMALLMRTIFVLFVLTILLSVILVAICFSSIYDIMYLVVMTVLSLLLGIRLFISRKKNKK